MTVRRASLAAAVLALGAACSNQAITQVARIQGTYDLALVNDLVFVTSTDRSELRVLDLTATPKGFVPAPNPIEALSIPVLDRPIGLGRDQRYVDQVNDDGSVVPLAQEVSGPYVYAISSGSAQISVVGADRTQPAAALLELMRLPTSGPVTAVAGTSPATAGGNSTLYFATYDGVSASLWTVALPPPLALQDTAVAQLQSQIHFVRRFENASVVALLSLPGERLVVATRAEQTGLPGSSLGETLLIRSDGATLQTLDFGAPVRLLATHATADLDFIDSGNRPVHDRRMPGDLIFAVLDEEACGRQLACSGILAFDTRTHQIALDVTGYPMTPIRLGNALPKGLSLKTYQPVKTSAANDAVTFEVLGAATASNGRIYFFNAGFLRQVDINTDGPSAVISSPVLTPGFVAGPIDTTVTLTDGELEDERVTLTYQGRIPGAVDLPATGADPLAFPLAFAIAPRVHPGDTIALVLPDGSECGVTDLISGILIPFDLAITQVDPPAVDGGPSIARVSGPIPAACSARVAFSVRAGGTDPYVVVDSLVGYLGRTGAKKIFQAPRPAYLALLKRRPGQKRSRLGVRAVRRRWYGRLR